MMLQEQAAAMLQEEAAMMLEKEEVQSEQMAHGSCDPPLLNVPNRPRSCLRPPKLPQGMDVRLRPHATQRRSRGGVLSMPGMEAARVTRKHGAAREPTGRDVCRLHLSEGIRLERHRVLVREPADVLFPLVDFHLLAPHNARTLLHQHTGV